MKRNVYIFLIFFMSGMLGFIFSLYRHRGAESVPPEISISKDTQLIQTFHYPAIFVKQLAGDPDAGRKIFKEFCATCHEKYPQIDIKAPRMGDKKIWHALHQLGVPVLLNMTINGVGAMPARGGCFECSDEQLKETIKYMLKHADE